MTLAIEAGERRPYIVAGPCSAESEEQVMELAKGLASRGVDLFRAGIWKPRTRPNTFDGIGSKGLEWLANARKESGIRISTEVAHPKHLEEAMQIGIDAVWLGARTTANPFSVQEIATALEGTDVPVFVKNPINPDLSLWIGAVERLQHAGVEDISLIHRGFSFFNSGKYRNSPLWQIPIDMRTEFPSMRMLCDVSHICGVRELLHDVAQAAMDLAFDGLMIETHPDPDNALSDNAQQVTLEGYDRIIGALIVRDGALTNLHDREELRSLRDQIDDLDDQLALVLGKRMDLTERIGEIKDLHDISVLQPRRWAQILDRARANAIKEGLSQDFIEELFKAIHQESIYHQLLVMNQQTKGIRE